MEELELVSAVRQFVQRRLEPIASEVEDTGVIPLTILQEMREMGLFGLTIPIEYGGLGLGLHTYCQIGMELAKTQQAFRSRINGNNGIGSRGLVVFGNDRQKSAFLPGLASGERLSAFAMTEPEAGSDASHLRTTAVKADGGYRLDGTKQFITNGPIANTILILAATDRTQGARGVTAFLLDTLGGDPPGLTRGPLLHKMGFRASLTCQLILEHCVVPDDCVIGRVGQGFSVAMTAVNDGRLTVAAGAVGAAEHLLQLAVDYAKRRIQFGKPIAEHQAIQHMIADMAIQVELARTLLLETAQRRDQGTSVAKQAAMTKVFATEMACRVADTALQVFGGYGYMADLPIERFYRDLRLLRIVEGTSEIQRNFIAREILKD